MPLLSRGAGLLAVLLLWGCSSAPQRQRVLVYGAASLTDALTALEAAFEAEHPQVDVALNLAATSTLARQIEAGAPADVFFSANPPWMAHLAAQHLVVDTVAVVGNRLVVAQRPDAPPLHTPADLVHIGRLALADPTHVPAGQYAKQALTCADLWATVQPRVVPALDVRAALLAVQSGAADAALVYATDVHQRQGVRLAFVWPADCTPSIRYVAARVRRPKENEWAARFLAYATHPDRQALWGRFGFISLRPS